MARQLSWFEYQTWMARRSASQQSSTLWSKKVKPVTPSRTVSARPPVARTTGHAAVAHRDHLAQPARLEQRRHQEDVAAAVDQRREGAVVAEHRRHLAPGGTPASAGRRPRSARAPEPSTTNCASPAKLFISRCTTWPIDVDALLPVQARHHRTQRHVVSLRQAEPLLQGALVREARSRSEFASKRAARQRSVDGFHTS